MQKIAALFAILVASLATPALSQSADEAAVARGMDALAKAIVAVDKAQLENLAWPELSYGHSAGRIENRAQYVEALVTKKSVITKIDYSKVATSVVGDIALVRGQMLFMVESTGKPVPTDLHFLMVWQKRGGEWKLLARQAYKA
jgi:hypothetical protein